MTEGSDANRRVMQEFITENDVQHKVTILSEDVCDTSVEQLVSPVSNFIILN